MIFLSQRQAQKDISLRCSEDGWVGDICATDMSLRCSEDKPKIHEIVRTTDLLSEPQISGIIGLRG